MKNYVSLGTLGRGGFGVVEKVLLKSEYFARKTFAPDATVPITSYDSLRKRFAREAWTQQELGGNEILPVLDSDLSGVEPWFVMPLADKTYEQQIIEDRASGKVDTLAIADILNSLQYLHELGYVHRDLNPRNILRHEGKWKLADFGAILPPTGNTITLTENTTICTESYCAPEQRKSFHKALPSADIYSFGCILDDIYGQGADHRTPYHHHKPTGVMGMIIDKCTHSVPTRRPSIQNLREMVNEVLWDVGNVCAVIDGNAGRWLEDLHNIESWTTEKYEDFGRFFFQLDLHARNAQAPGTWVYADSTPFLTRLSTDTLRNILTRGDGTSEAIIEKYCGWIKETNFEFTFADVISDRLAVIFDNGSPSDAAAAFSALARLGSSHNRWYVMRCMLNRADKEKLNSNLAKRLRITLRTDETVNDFKQCVSVMSWPITSLSPELVTLL